MLYLQVSQPPVVSRGFEGGKPSACEIEKDDGDSPCQVKQWKAPDITLRRFRIAHGMVGEQPRTDESQPYLRNQQCERVDQGNVKHVEEERHTSENSNSAGDRSS